MLLRPWSLACKTYLCPPRDRGCRGGLKAGMGSRPHQLAPQTFCAWRIPPVMSRAVEELLGGSWLRRSLPAAGWAFRQVTRSQPALGEFRHMSTLYVAVLSIGGVPAGPSRLDDGERRPSVSNSVFFFLARVRTEKQLIAAFDSKGRSPFPAQRPANVPHCLQTLPNTPRIPPAALQRAAEFFWQLLLFGFGAWVVDAVASIPRRSPLTSCAWRITPPFMPRGVKAPWRLVASWLAPHRQLGHLP